MKNYLFILMVIPFSLLISCNNQPTSERVEATEPAPAAENTSATETGTPYNIQTDQSIINWFGANKLTPKKHNGTLRLSQGTLSMNNGQIAGGSFVADMTSIANNDLAGTESEGKLVRHLKSADFFEVETYPTATFTITSVSPSADGKPDTYQITGNMTIKGITKQITFPASVHAHDNSIHAQADFTIDRSQWNVQYGSESFFPDLVGDKIISNDIRLNLNIVAQTS